MWVFSAHPVTNKEQTVTTKRRNTTLPRLQDARRYLRRLIPPTRHWINPVVNEIVNHILRTVIVNTTRTSSGRTTVTPGLLESGTSFSSGSTYLWWVKNGRRRAKNSWETFFKWVTSGYTLGGVRVYTNNVSTPRLSRYTPGSSISSRYVTPSPMQTNQNIKYGRPARVTYTTCIVRGRKSSLTYTWRYRNLIFSKYGAPDWRSSNWGSSWGFTSVEHAPVYERKVSFFLFFFWVIM